MAEIRLGDDSESEKTMLPVSTSSESSPTLPMPVVAQIGHRFMMTTQERLPLYSKVSLIHWRRGVKGVPASVVSKVDQVAADIHPDPHGFVLGTMSDDHFSNWVRKSPSRIQNAIVRDAAWWKSKQRPFHHQFIVLTVECQSVGGDSFHVPILYHIRLERIGKRVGLKRMAEQKVTVTVAKPLSHLGQDNVLMFGLLGASGPSCSVSPRQALTSPPYHLSGAFLDRLDDKWRGPPATLWQISRYVESIVQLAPKYSLETRSTNCYCFARLLMHTIGLRHYSFTSLAVTKPNYVVIRSRVHDPSGIGMLFRFLCREEEGNGVLLRQDVMDIISTVTILALIGVMIYGSILFCRHVTNAPAFLPMIWAHGGLVVVYIYACLMGVVSVFLVGRVQGSITSLTSSLIEKLALDPTLTPNPKARRGPFVPGPYAPIAWPNPEQNFGYEEPTLASNKATPV